MPIVEIDMRWATWICCAAATAEAVAMLLWTRTGIVITPLLTMVAGVTGLIGMHVIYTRWRPLPVVGAMTAGLAALSWAGLAAGVSALAALRTGAPLIDTGLARADAALHVDTREFVFWVTSLPHLGTLLDVAYLSAVPLETVRKVG